MFIPSAAISSSPRQRWGASRSAVSTETVIVSPPPTSVEYLSMRASMPLAPILIHGRGFSVKVSLPPLGGYRVSERLRKLNVRCSGLLLVRVKVASGAKLLKSRRSTLVSNTPETISALAVLPMAGTG